jgi:hypothetical protein
MTLCLAAIVAATFLPAQGDPKAPAQPPNPKTKEHDALAALAGHWQTTCKMNAMPGVPGMEKASESTGTEHTELICNGLWLKSTIHSTWQGKPFQGVWLAGWDPIAKTYRSIWVSSMEDEAASEMTGNWDEKAKTWTFSGKVKEGEIKSQFVFKDNDNSTETCWLTTPDGKQTECMQITRKRGKAGMPQDASATSDTAAAKEMLPLAQQIGRWTGKVTLTMPGQAPDEQTCTENVVKICNGRWTWSDVKGSMMGMPFEGHAITGYDNTSKQFISFWVDSCGSPPMRTSGTYDEAKKQFTFTGDCFDDQGKPATVKQMLSQPDANVRNFHMIMNCSKGPSEMKIAYTRLKG